MITESPAIFHKVSVKLDLIHMPKLVMCHFVNEPIPLPAFPNDFQVKETTDYNNVFAENFHSI